MISGCFYEVETNLFDSKNPINQFLAKLGLPIIDSDLAPVRITKKLLNNFQTKSLELRQKIIMGQLNWLDKNNFPLQVISILKIEGLSDFLLKKQKINQMFFSKRIQSNLGLVLEEGDGWSNRVKRLIHLSYKYGVEISLLQVCGVDNACSFVPWQFKNDFSTQGLLVSLEEKKSISLVINDFECEINNKNINYSRLRASFIFFIKNVKAQDTVCYESFLNKNGAVIVNKIFSDAPNDFTKILFYVVLIKLMLVTREKKISGGFYCEHVDSDIFGELVKQTRVFVKNNTRLNSFCDTAELLLNNFSELNLVHNKFPDAEFSTATTDLDLDPAPEVLDTPTAIAMGA